MNALFGVKTVTLATFRLFGTEILPMGAPLTIPNAVTYLQSAMEVWDFFIFETMDESVGIVFTDPQTHEVQAAIY